jgi:hypothetical protein
MEDNQDAQQNKNKLNRKKLKAYYNKRNRVGKVEQKLRQKEIRKRHS